MIKRLFTGAIVLILLVSGLFGSVHVVGTLLAAPSNNPIHIPRVLEAEPVLVKSESGSTLSASWVTGRKGAPVIVLMHGIRASRDMLVKRAGFFKSLGCHVLLFDFRAHGESPGGEVTFGHLEGLDAQAAMRYAKKREPRASLGVISLSLGGASVILAPQVTPVDALVLEAVYPDIRTAIDNRIRRWVGPLSDVLTPLFIGQIESRLGIKESQLRPIDQIGRFKSPILLLSGAADPHTTESDTRALYAAAQEPKRIELFEGAGHVDLYDFAGAKYEKTVAEFFREYLRGFPP